MHLPDNAPFTAEDRSALNAIFARTAPAQRYWLSGFLAGVDTQAGAALGAATVAAPAAAAAPAVAAPAAAVAIPLTILFGTESGNSEELAQRSSRKAAKLGFSPKVVDMAEIKLADLPKNENLLVIVSTWGDGEPPDRVTSFYEQIFAAGAPRLDKSRFSVLALGDSSYPKFCQTGKDFDRRLEELGAKRYHPRTDCDVDYEGAFEKWTDGALGELLSHAAPKVVSAPAAAASISVSEPAPAAAAVAAPVIEYGKKNPFPAELKQRVLLNGRGSSKETIHLEFSLAGSGLTYEAGDALAVVPSNCPEVVADVLKAGKWSNSDTIETPDGSSGPMGDVLQQYYDITGLSKVIMKKYNELAPSDKLSALLEDKDGLSAYTYGREISDLLTDFPIANLSPKDFLSILRKLPPRLYSIASSMRAHPDEVHLTVGAVRYSAHGKKRKGVCSTYLAERAPVGQGVAVYTHHNKNFKLPADSDAPVIMVGPGTGIAPFRSFIEDRAATGAKGKNWLFFGDQHFTTDFLYQLEWQQYLKDGVLSRLDTAFSRDQEEKIYVQTRMLEAGKDLYDWLENGASFYVCGDASRMANDVHQALLAIVATHGGKSAEEAEAYIKKLQKDRRYCRDVY